MFNNFEWGLWYAAGNNWLPHSYVYRKVVTLQSGVTYHFQTRNLHSWLAGPNPDPVMFLVQRDDIVAYNDDYTGLASEIIYTATQTGPYTIVISAFTTGSPGFCDLYQGTGGDTPVLIHQNLKFGGTYVWTRWKLGEWFETGGSVYTTQPSPGSDPYLFLVYPERSVGSKMYMDDDSAGKHHAKIVPPTEGDGIIILGSYSQSTEGQCQLGIIGQSYKAPWLSPAPWASDAEPVALNPRVSEYMEELKRRKPALEKMSLDKRDQRVLQLQRKMLSEEQIRQISCPAPSYSPVLARRQEDFLERYKQIEKDLVKMSYKERTARLAQLKREAMGKEYSEPEKSLSPKTGK